MEMNVPKLSPPLKWHGGKHYLADRIIALMPAHLHYVEPFFGGGAVLLAKNPDGISEVANDINGWLSNFWNVLREVEPFERFRRMAEATPFSQPVWDAVVSEMAAEPDLRHYEPVRAAFMFFVRCRQSRAGLMRDFATLSRNRTRRRMNGEVSAWLTTVEGLPSVHQRLQRVVILNAPAVHVIRQQDGSNTLFYLDPPYPHMTRSTIDSYGDFEMSTQDHAKLLDTIGNCQGKVMISSYDSDLYAEKLRGWNRYFFDLPNNAAAGASKHRMTEVLWCNF